MCLLTVEKDPGIHYNTELWVDPAPKADCPDKNQGYARVEHFFSLNFINV